MIGQKSTFKELALNRTESSIKLSQSSTFYDVNFCQGLFYAYLDVWSTYWTWPAIGVVYCKIIAFCLPAVNISSSEIQMMAFWHLQGILILISSHLYLKVKELTMKRRGGQIRAPNKVEDILASFKHSWYLLLHDVQFFILFARWLLTTNLDRTLGWQQCSVEQFWFVEGGNFGSGGGYKVLQPATVTKSPVACKTSHRGPP